ncbi:MAG TPA: hypothetical protein VK585_08515 [Jiangellaceae bacterium]|nr:hypothetical protein [Jiangellaceae bacterium]
MLVAGGGFCVGVSRAALKAAGATLGDDVELSIARPPAPPDLYVIAFVREYSPCLLVTSAVFRSSVL